MNKRHVLVTALAMSSVLYFVHAEDDEATTDATEAATEQVEEKATDVTQETQEDETEAADTQPEATEPEADQPTAEEPAADETPAEGEAALEPEVQDTPAADETAAKPEEETAAEQEAEDTPAEGEPAEKEAEDTPAEGEPAEKEPEAEDTQAPKPQQEPEPAPEPVPEVTPEENMTEALVKEEDIGFRGNWVKKRQWLKRAMAENNRLQDLVLAISEARGPYMEQYFAISRELDGFYTHIGKTREKIKDLGNELRGYLEKLQVERLAVAIDVEQQEKIAKELAGYAKEIADFEQSVTNLSTFEEALRKRIERLDAQVNEALQLAGKARGIYEEIWDIIDDQKAQAHFYEIQGTLAPKIQTIHDYVTGSLKTDYDGVLKSLQTNLDELRDLVKKLESHDFIVTKRFERLTELKKAPPPAEPTTPTLDQPGVIIRFWNWLKGLFSIGTITNS